MKVIQHGGTKVICPLWLSSYNTECCNIITQLYLVTLSVADAGFLEGGFCYNNACKACAKLLGPHSLLIKLCPFLSVFERSFLLYLSIHLFSIDIFAMLFTQTGGVLFSLSSCSTSLYQVQPKGGFHGTLGTPPLNPPLIIHQSNLLETVGQFPSVNLCQLVAKMLVLNYW